MRRLARPDAFHVGWKPLEPARAARLVAARTSPSRRALVDAGRALNGPHAGTGLRRVGARLSRRSSRRAYGDQTARIDRGVVGDGHTRCDLGRHAHSVSQSRSASHLGENSRGGWSRAWEANHRRSHASVRVGRHRVVRVERTDRQGLRCSRMTRVCAEAARASGCRHPGRLFPCPPPLGYIPAPQATRALPPAGRRTVNHV